MTGNPNHPDAGSQIKVEPIRELKDIKVIKKLLAATPRDLALFVIGINTSLRASDLVRLTVGQLRGIKPMDELEIKEKKTGKIRRISFNRACIEAVQGQLNSLQSCYIRPDGHPFFASRRGGGALKLAPCTGWSRVVPHDQSPW